MNILASVDIGQEFDSPWGQGSYTLGHFVGLVVESAIVIAGVVMIFLIIGGGLSIIAGAGQQRPESVARGKKAVTAALIGFIIIFTAYWIVRAIELMLGTNSLLP